MSMIINQKGMAKSQEEIAQEERRERFKAAIDPILSKLPELNVDELFKKRD